MALVPVVNSELLWPVRVPLSTIKGISGTTAVDRSFLAVALMNDANDDTHFVGNIRWADRGANKTVERIFFVPTNLTSPNGTLRAGLQNVTTGVQAKRGDGTFDRSGTLAATTLVTDAVNFVTMTAGSQTYSDGDLVAIVFDWVAYVSGSFEFKTLNRVNETSQFPCCTLNTALTNGIPNLLLYASDGTYGVIQGGGWGIGTTHISFNSVASPNEYGNRLTVPFSCRVNGIWVRRSIANNLGTPFYVGIYDSSGVTVVERLIGSDQVAGSAGEYKLETYVIPETTLASDTTYIVSVRSASTDAVGLEFVSVGAYAYMAPFPGGSDLIPMRRVGGSGPFSPYTTGTGQFTLGLAISAIDDGEGSGWTPGTGTTGNTLKLLIDPNAASAATISGAVFASPSGTNMVGPKIGEFTGETFEVTLEDGKAVLKVPVTSFGGEGLLLTDLPVVLVRNDSYTTGFVQATVINE